ncbi:hypothetical protein BDN67DRAFT_966439 [Paxillus ammoniavirescens]|nr:hypothetical protein BDN67DRAFT_966439 [Paxillus ammoniavirescens]
MVLKSDTSSTRKREGWNHRNRSSQSDINTSFEALKHSSTRNRLAKRREAASATRTECESRLKQRIV